MCRFTAYFGQKPIVLRRILAEPKYSLVSQSMFCREGNSVVNGDGFGVGWYDHRIDQLPGLFKSVLPAWNDENLHNLTSRITSKCFIGHIRASTVSSVSFSNCHPFHYGQLLFAHNGTINEFEKIKKVIVNEVSTEILSIIKGQTDSEYFFALFCHLLKGHPNKVNEKEASLALIEAIKAINKFQDEAGVERDSGFNFFLTNGHFFIAVRYTSSPKTQPISLYYHKNYTCEDPKKAVTISSEALSDSHAPEGWREVPANSMLIIDKNYQIHENFLKF